MSKTRTILITGGTGFIGRHAVRGLVESGHRVRALCRAPSKSLEDDGAEVVLGDVLDLASVKSAVEGADAVVHGAGAVSRDREDAGWLMRVHVTGSRFVAGAAARAGVKRFVNLSTSGTVAVGDDPDVVFHEDDAVPFDHIHRFPYYLSKWLAERAVKDVARLTGGEMELITLNPSLVLGPGDTRSSSTTDVQRFLNREIPIVPSGGFSFVDARDVADVAVRCLEAGRPGERYLLGALNLTFAEFFDRLSEVTGHRGPLVPFALPRALTRLSVGVMEKVADAVGVKLPVTEVEADMSSLYWYVDTRRAQEELDWAPREPMQTLLDTVKDLRGEAVGERTVSR
jgi:dihydroflavonol-4-reductase